MLRPAGLLAPFSGILCHRASTLGSLHQLPVSYEATWLLPRLNLHQLVVPSLARRAKIKNRVNRGFLCIYVLVLQQLL
ncbi:MAG: hypothetical protein K0R47_4428 [Brevibacillus sp.]|jgi:hypothetical protein|nr:hypothetical protein [Brevibacillus sp.]